MGWQSKPVFQSRSPRYKDFKYHGGVGCGLLYSSSECYSNKVGKPLKARASTIKLRGGSYSKKESSLLAWLALQKPLTTLQDSQILNEPKAPKQVLPDDWDGMGLKKEASSLSNRVYSGCTPQNLLPNKPTRLEDSTRLAASLEMMKIQGRRP